MRLQHPLILTILAIWAGSAAAAPLQKRSCASTAVERFVEAWNRADAGSIAALFLDTGDLVIPTGQLFSGAATIDDFYRRTFGSGYAGSRAAAVIVQARTVAPGVCLADGTWKIAHAHRAGAGEGDESGLFSALLVYRQGAWKINALREQTSAQKVEIMQRSPRRSM